ncbi:hypothetical protein [Nitratireductor sp. OM-1]|uniref:hypothetical protein n=1 Tax=Nitratireductor sp. OM-1 TaxID=1756988 RepID=UPI0013AF046D|nr:hypothetical protein [Nitratireductor sp. OM-1]
MPDRVLIDASGVRVSKSGFDVKTASEAQLMFNSRWSAMKRLVFGQFDIWIPPEGELANSKTILFGKTFNYRPLVFSAVLLYNDHTGPDRDDRSAQQHIGTAAYFVFYNPRPPIRYVVNVQNDRFIYSVNSSYRGTDGVWTKNRVYYAVWDHGLG